MKKNASWGKYKYQLNKKNPLIQPLSLQVCLICKVAVSGWLLNVSWETSATGVCPGNANEFEQMTIGIPSSDFRKGVV